VTNAVIIYTGNVCSTPMVAYAGLTRDVFVPFFERFDHAKFQVTVPDPSRQSAELAEALSALYERRHTPVFDHPRFVRYLDWAEIPSAAEKPHVLFKWRPFQPEMPDSHLITQAFERHGAMPTMIARQSVVEQAIKVFLTEKIYGDSHQQFTAAKMTAAEYDAYTEGQREMQVEISDEDLVVVHTKARQFLHRTKSLVRCAQYFFPHAPAPQVIISEDIFRPALDRERYNAVLSHLLGATQPLDAQTETDVRKAGLDLQHCANLEAVLADAELQAVEAKYNGVITDLGVLRPFAVE